jgi:hypothetical protein
MIASASIFFKVIYAQVLLQYTHKLRFFLGISLNFLSITFLYLGIVFRVLPFIYVAAVLLGIGTALTYLSIMGYLKYFPIYFMNVYVIAVALAGFFMSSLYLLSLSVHFDFYRVSILLSSNRTGDHGTVSTGGCVSPGVPLLRQTKNQYHPTHPEERRPHSTVLADGQNGPIGN